MIKARLNSPTTGLRVMAATTLISLTASSWGYGTGLCNDELGACSVYAYIENGEKYALSALVADEDMIADPKMAHILFTRGLWEVNGRLARDDFAVLWGPEGGTPVAGDWNGDGDDGVGVAWNLENGTIFVMANFSFADPQNPELVTVPANYLIPVTNGTPIVGDWDGDGIDSFGVYKDGVFTLANNGVPRQIFTMDLSALLPTHPLAAADTKGIVVPWNGDGIDYISLALPNQIISASEHIPGYVHGEFIDMGLHISPISRIEGNEVPAAIPGNPDAIPFLPWVGALLAPPDEAVCLNSARGTPGPTCPNNDGGVIRPGGDYNWFP